MHINGNNLAARLRRATRGIRCAVWCRAARGEAITWNDGKV